jgi:hypothetical protein
LPLKNILADFAVDRNVANMTTIDVVTGTSKLSSNSNMKIQNAEKKLEDWD